MRSDIADCRLSPVENLFTSPSFETGSGDVTVYENLFTNPSFEASSGTVEVRKNLLINPQGTTPGSERSLVPRWYGNGGGAGQTTYGLEESNLPEGVKTYARKTWTAIGTSSQQDIAFALTSGPRMAVIAGQTIRLRVWWRTSVTKAPGTNALRLRVYDSSSGGVILGAEKVSPNFPAPTPGVWQLVEAVFDITESGYADFFHLVNYFDGGLTVGSTLDATAALVEINNGRGPYLDGSAPPKLRRNRAISPRQSKESFESRSRWNWITTYSTAGDGPPGIPTYTRSSPGSSGTFGANRGFDWYHNADVAVYSTPSLKAVSVYAGEELEISAWVRASRNVNQLFNYRIHDGVNWVNSGTRDVSSTISANKWTRVKTIITVPFSGYLVVRNEINAVDWSSSDTYDQTGIYIGPPGEYFDGVAPPSPDLAVAWEGEFDSSPSYVYDPDFTSSWLDVPNASESVLRAAGVTGTLVGGRTTYQSSRWSASGSKSLAILPYTTADSFAELRSMMPPIEQLRGKTFTVMGTVHLKEKQASSGLYGTARSFRIAVQTPSGQLELAPQEIKPPNEVGSHSIRHTFSIPADATALNFFRIYNGDVPGGVTVRWDNLALVEGAYAGPYFDGSTITKVRRNLALNPRATNWSPSASAGNTAQIESVVGLNGAPARKLTVTTVAPTGDRTHRIGGITRIPCRPGDSFPVSIDASSSEKPVLLQVDYYNNGAYITAKFSPTVTPSNDPSNPTRILFIPEQAPAETTHMVVYLRISDGQVGDWITGSRLFVGDSGAYFDGESSDLTGGYATTWEGTPNASPSYAYDQDLTISWSGTPNASTSKVTGVGILNITSSGCAAIRSSRWKKSGQYSMRLISTSRGVDAYAEFVVPGGPRLRGHTILATRYQTDVVSPIVGSAERDRGIYTIVDGGKRPGIRVFATTNTMGEEDMRGFLIPEEQVTRMRLYHGGAQGSGDVWWDCAGLFEGRYDGPYLDGNMPNSVWRGIPHASPSVGYPSSV